MNFVIRFGRIGCGGGNHGCEGHFGKKYVVRLSGEEREQLEVLIRKGESAAQRLLKARILLKADVSEAGEGWSDNRIIKALQTSASMVYRVRKQLPAATAAAAPVFEVDNVAAGLAGK
jgi:hypothetical protein